MNSIRTVATLIVALFSVQAMAQDPLADFENVFAKKWQFKCDIDVSYGGQVVPGSFINDVIKYQALTAVKQGLTDLSEINPALFARIIKYRSGKKVVWGCDFTSKLALTTGGHHTKSYLFNKSKIKVSLATIQRIFPTILEHGTSLRLREVLLHEFYHSANIDNQKTSVHAEGWHRTEQGNVLDDVVYACTAQTYRTKYVWLDWREDSAIYRNSQQLCRICASAIPNKKNDVKLPRQLISNPRCDSIDDEEHLIGYMEYNPEKGFSIRSIESIKIAEDYDNKIKSFESEFERIGKERDRQVKDLYESLGLFKEIEELSNPNNY